MSPVKAYVSGGCRDRPGCAGGRGFSGQAWRGARLGGGGGDRDVFHHALERIKADGVPYSAGPGHTPGEINHNHGGRGVYFDDSSGHHFELITQRYGTGP